MTGPPGRAAARRRGGLAARVRGDPAPGRPDHVDGDGGDRTPCRASGSTIEPFRLDDPVRTELVIDRLAHWYYHPREWLKKAALVNGTYLLNSPFTFQSMEKHSAYCALVRMGLKVPPTTLVPYKNPVDNVRWAYTSEKYNREFDLDRVAEDLGYPLYMKPFDGGAWRGVSRINDRGDLHRAYDESGEMLMHLQATVDYEHFARALSIGPETMVMDFRPDQPMHQRYAVNHGFLSESAGRQTVAISRIVNAFFRWEFNSCEMLVVGDDVYPIDYANACPDVAVTSLHYYFPWAITALVRWSTYCVVTGRKADVDLQTQALLRDRRRRVAVVRREAGPLPRPGRRALRDRALLGVVRAAPRPPRPRRCSSGSPATTSTGCCATPSPRRTRRTSRRSSSPTSAAWSGCGPPSSWQTGGCAQNR